MLENTNKYRNHAKAVVIAPEIFLTMYHYISQKIRLKPQSLEFVTQYEKIVWKKPTCKNGFLRSNNTSIIENTLKR